MAARDSIVNNVLSFFMFEFLLATVARFGDCGDCMELLMRAQDHEGNGVAARRCALGDAALGGWASFRVFPLPFPNHGSPVTGLSPPWVKMK